MPKAQKRGFGRRQPAFRFGRKVGFFRSAQFFRRRNASRPKFDMDAQRVRSGEIKSCRCKSQVLQGYYNSVTTATGLFAGRFPTPNPVNTAAGAAGNLRGGAYAPDWRNFRIPLRGRNRSPSQDAGPASFCGTNISPLKRAEKGAQNPLPRVLCPRFSLCVFDAHAAHNRIAQIPP